MKRGSELYALFIHALKEQFKTGTGFSLPYCSYVHLIPICYPNIGNIYELGVIFKKTEAVKTADIILGLNGVTCLESCRQMFVENEFEKEGIKV